MEKVKLSIYVEDYNVPLNPWCFLNEVLSKYCPKIIRGFKAPDNLMFFEKNRVLWGTDEKEWNRMGILIENKILKDKLFVNKIYNEHLKSLKSIKNNADFLLGEDLKKKSNSALFKLYKKVHDQYSHCWAWAMCIQFLDQGSNKFSDRIRIKLNSKLKKIGEPSSVFMKLITPNKSTLIEKEGFDLLRAISKIQNNKNYLNRFKKSKSIEDLPRGIKSVLDGLANRYGWLQYYYMGPPADSVYYYDYIKRRLNTAVSIKIKSKEKEHSQIKDFQNKYYKFFDKDELYLLNLLKTFLYLKEFRKEIQMYYFNFANHKLYSEIARRFSWTVLQAKYVLIDEYKKMLLDGKNVLNEYTLNNRYDCFAYLCINGKVNVYSGRSAKKFKNLFKSIKTREINNISGNIAHNGKVCGIVKIVNAVEDISKFENGNILVSFSTNPSLIPAMIKAGAIVTDTGGVTCHAAIVSRELRIPCIIGTKIATKVLKDGDLVEVDANNGIIKILNN